MSDKPKNALAELAKRLLRDIGDKDTIVKKPATYQDLLKAQRIVAELAKCWRPSAKNECVNDYVEAFENCRAITEEGANDEGK